MKTCITLFSLFLTFISLSQPNVIWSDDFSVPGNWNMTNTSQPISWGWAITTNQNDIPQNAAPTLQTFDNVSAANGFALINSDGQPGNTDGDGAIVAEITNATPIDLSSYPNVLLNFKHIYQWRHGIRGVRVSGDNGNSWTDFEITDSLYYPVSRVSLNSEEETFDISSIAGGQTQVLIQFYYNDNDYLEGFWAVDDVRILEQPANDIELLSAHFTKLDNGTEYLESIIDWTDTNYYVGVKIINRGFNDQVNVTMTVDFPGLFFLSDTLSIIPAGDTVVLEQLISITPGWSSEYTGNYQISSSNDTLGGVMFYNNTYVKSIAFSHEVCFEGYSFANYNLINPIIINESSFGTGSCIGCEDGLNLANLYYFDSYTSWYGPAIIVHLADGCVPGGEIYGSIKDSSTFVQNDMTSLHWAYPHTISASDIANGYIFIFFPTPVSLTPGFYYVSIELYSNGNSSPIYIKDDYSMNQDANNSMTYIAGDSTYKDGNAYGIDLYFWCSNIEEKSQLNLTVQPNPSNGLISVDFDSNDQLSIQIRNISGQLIYETEVTSSFDLDLSAKPAGVYFVTASNGEFTTTEKLILE